MSEKSGISEFPHQPQPPKRRNTNSLRVITGSESWIFLEKRYQRQGDLQIGVQGIKRDFK